jgi:hypothetical protein
MTWNLEELRKTKKTSEVKPVSVFIFEPGNDGSVSRVAQSV